MSKKITLLLFICCIVSFGFAQKSKKKNSPPKNSYFEMTINGETTLAAGYCPNDTIVFSFIVKDSSILDREFHWKWYPDYHNYNPVNDDKEELRLPFPIDDKITYPNVTKYKISLVFEISTETDSFEKVILTTEISIDYDREIVLEEKVCYGRKITITTLNGDTTFYNVTLPIKVWDTITASPCIKLLGYLIEVSPLIEIPYSISSCDSVIWGDIIVKPTGEFVDNKYETDVYRLFFSTNQNPCCECDTMKKLSVTIIDTTRLSVKFDQFAFCSGDDMGGTIELETDFTAFDWTYLDTDSIWSELRNKSLEVELSGSYYVLAYMDTSLYDTLKDLRIVNCSKDTIVIVEDCKLIIPNVLTPNGDGYNDVFGIKKLNLSRENELTIYDRWGKSVYHQRNYKCIYKKGNFENIDGAFDGKSRGGEDLPEGTYYYAFKYNAFPDKNKKTYTGTLMIIR
ncbi:MAG: gliding motility-associated C-terminal domain-containing protein [Bacteroidales bacterium]|jgi:gliding motility-associated-like protein|nr:gliding motility-associated C-terminal domain-containing protein [Bacteroidales bacterium]